MRALGDVPTVKPRWLRACALGILALVLSTFAWWPMIAAYPHVQMGDGAQYHKTLEAARVSVVRYHEFPHWNPYECGGLALWDNPQAPIGAPLAWPVYFANGSTEVVYFWYVVHSAIGFVCMWLLGRHELKLDRFSTFIAASVWAFAGFHQQHYMGGHFTFVPFLYFPLALLLWRRAENDLRCAVGLGVLVAWMMMEGGVYPIPHLAVILFVETLTRVWPLKRLGKIAIAGAAAGPVALGLGAIRFLPVFDQLKRHTRAIGVETDALQWQTFKDMFLARTHEWTVQGQTYVWPEYGAYLGPIILTLAIVGVLTCKREHLWVLLLLVFSGALMFGHAAKWAPWAFLKGHVFPFKEMRVPSRFRAEVTLFLAAFAGLAVHRLVTHVRRLGLPWSTADATRTAIIAVACLAVGDIVSLGMTRAETAFQQPPEDRHPIIAPHIYLDGPGLAQMIDQPRQNRGRITCWDEWGFGAGAPLWPGDVPQARSDDADIVVTNVSRTQNTFTFDVDAKKPGRVLVNSTYDRNFQTNVGTLSEDDKLLVLDVPAGTHHVHIRNWPRYFNAGLTITLVTLFGVIGFFVGWPIFQRRRRASLAR